MHCYSMTGEGQASSLRVGVRAGTDSSHLERIVCVLPSSGGGGTLMPLKALVTLPSSWFPHLPGPSTSGPAWFYGRA